MTPGKLAGRKRSGRKRSGRSGVGVVSTGRRSPKTRIALLYQALGCDRLTIRALTERVGDLIKKDGDVYESHIRQLAYGMYQAGELHRSEHFHGKRAYYRYFRPTNLEGPIADLARRFHDEPKDER